jgi:hypothetical protein
LKAPTLLAQLPLSYVSVSSAVVSFPQISDSLTSDAERCAFPVQAHPLRKDPRTRSKPGREAVLGSDTGRHAGRTTVGESSRLSIRLVQAAASHDRTLSFATVTLVEHLREFGWASKLQKYLAIDIRPKALMVMSTFEGDDRL